MDREVALYQETSLLDILEEERAALRRADVDALLALAERKVEAARSPLPRTEVARLRELAAENRDLLAHLLECLRSALIAAVTPDGSLYGSFGETCSEPQPLQRRYS